MIQSQATDNITASHVFFSFLFFSSLSPLLFSSCAHFFFALKGMIAGFFFISVFFSFLFLALVGVGESRRCVTYNKISCCFCYDG
jgi:hypothetical protein